nr:hypothetical protein [Bacillus velezensis]
MPSDGRPLKYQAMGGLFCVPLSVCFVLCSEFAADAGRDSGIDCTVSDAVSFTTGRSGFLV